MCGVSLPTGSDRPDCVLPDSDSGWVTDVDVA